VPEIGHRRDRVDDPVREVGPVAVGGRSLRRAGGVEGEVDFDTSRLRLVDAVAQIGPHSRVHRRLPAAPCCVNAGDIGEPRAFHQHDRIVLELDVAQFCDDRPDL
jgi:hypothetical protein